MYELTGSGWGCLLMRKRCKTCVNERGAFFLCLATSASGKADFK